MTRKTGWLVGLAAFVMVGSAWAQSGAVRISQVNGTGRTQSSWLGPTGNYVELHNTGGSAADLTGYALQVSLTTGTSWSVVPFPAGFTIPAGRYALVQLGSARVPANDPNNPGDASATTSPGFVISPDVTGAPPFQISSSGGKLALTGTQTALTGGCPTGAPIVDFVGFGSADCYETSPALGQSNFDGRALYRGCDGSVDTNNNAADFSLMSSSPRNLASPANMGPMVATGSPVESAAVTVVQNNSVLLRASASSCAGAPTGVSFTANLSFVGGPASAPMYDDGTHGDQVAGDGMFSLTYVVPDTLLPAPPPGPSINRPYIVPMTGVDSLGRAAHAYAAFYVTAAPTGACCAAGQVSVRTAASCAAMGGTYLGDHSSPFGAEGPTYPGAPVVGIPSPGTVSDSIVVTDQIPVGRVIVHLQCDHTYLGDLRCTLSKGATTVTLFEHVGVAGNNATGRPGNFDGATTYTFMDGGASFWNAAYNGGKDTNYYEPGGYYAPSGAANAPSSLAPFVGSSSDGTWTLTMLDWVATDSGSFHWSIEFNPTPACTGTCSADFDCDGDVGTDADIEGFFACLAGSCPSAPCMSSADFNGDGDVGTDADIEAFFRVLAGGAC